MVRQPVVLAENLCKSYGSKCVLEGIDLDVQPGEHFCLLGRNGSGKSTLMEIIMGLKKPTRGEILVLGSSPQSRHIKDRRAMLLDRPIFPYYAKVIEVARLYRSFYRRWMDLDELLATFRIDQNAFIRHLSRGELQRVGLLLVLLGDPDLILLDEPTSGLDPQGRLEFWRVLSARLSSSRCPTLIFATHDFAEADRWADRIGILHRGRLVDVAPPQELCRRTIGAQRKVMVAAQEDRSWQSLLNGHIASVTRLGSEWALYTDRPEEVVRQLAMTGLPEIRVEKVSIADAYFKLTGETLDDKPVSVR